MPTYRVQLKDCETLIRVESDDNPTTESFNGFRNRVMVFKRDQQIVAQFVTSEVVGWWQDKSESKPS